MTETTYTLDTNAIEQVRQDGYQSGLNWPDTWEDHPKPGGPWVNGGRYTEKERQMAAQSSAERQAWLEAWERGHADKLAQGRVNPKRSTDENARHHRN
jgi:ribosome modulation factor